MARSSTAKKRLARRKRVTLGNGIEMRFGVDGRPQGLVLRRAVPERFHHPGVPKALVRSLGKLDHDEAHAVADWVGRNIGELWGSVEDHRERGASWAEAWSYSIEGFDEALHEQVHARRLAVEEATQTLPVPDLGKAIPVQPARRRIEVEDPETGVLYSKLEVDTESTAVGAVEALLDSMRAEGVNGPLEQLAKMLAAGIGQAVAEKVRAAQVVAPLVPQATVEAPAKLGDLLPSYLAKRRTEVKEVRPAYYETLVSFLGADTMAHEVTVGQCEAFLRQQHEEAGVAWKTIRSRYRGHFKGFFDWLVSYKHAVSNPMEETAERMDLTNLVGVERRAKASEGEEYDDDESRVPFKREELAKLLTIDFYRPKNPTGTTPETRLNRCLATLIRLHSGMRPQEVCWLRPQDVTRIDGVPVMLVRSFKNRDSAKAYKDRGGVYEPKGKRSRAVPIHPELVEIVEALAEQRQGEEYLLREITTARSGDRAQPTCRPLSRWMRQQLDTVREGLVPNSTRHSVITELEEMGFSRNDVGLLTGHVQQEGNPITGVYSSAKHLKKLRAMVSKLDWRAECSELLAAIREDVLGE